MTAGLAFALFAVGVAVGTLVDSFLHRNLRREVDVLLTMVRCRDRGHCVGDDGVCEWCGCQVVVP